MLSQISNEAVLWLIFGLFCLQLVVLLWITWPRAGEGLPIPATTWDGELAELNRNPHAW